MPIPRPQEAPVFSTEASQPFARRSVSAIFWVAVAVLVAGFLFGWYVTADRNVGPQGYVMADGTFVEAENRGALYNLFHEMFDGMDSGLSESAADFNLGTDQTASGVTDGLSSYARIATEAGTGPASQNEITAITLEEMKDARVLDFEGHPVGVVDRVSDYEGTIHSVYVILEGHLAAYPGHKVTIPYGAFETASNEDYPRVYLSKAYTKTLAAQLFY